MTADIWSLPSPAAWIDSLARSRAACVVIPGDPTLPVGWQTALARQAQSRGRQVLRARAEATKAGPHAFGRLGSPSGAGPIVLCDVSNCAGPSRRAWLDQTLSASPAARGAPTLVLSGVPRDEISMSGPPVLAWNDRLRRHDVALWADLHARPLGADPVPELAQALAVELLGWRFDLVRELMRASVEDLVDPVGWLTQRKQPALSGAARYAGRPFACPLHLAARARDDRDASAELSRRVWRAQVAAVFPWIEERRASHAERYKGLLHVDDDSRKSGAVDVLQLEFGAMKRQLLRVISPHEIDRLERFRLVRNALAHGKPAPVSDLLSLLRVEHEA
jgi:hypothetical protein